jgi:signal transduction histidine kinase
MDRRELNLHESFEKGIRNIYQIASYIILTGNLLDLQKYAKENKILLYSNTANILIICFFIIGFYTKKISFKIGFSVLIYTIVANIYIGKFVSSIDISDSFRIYFFLRDSLFIALLMTLASFALNKIHSVIIGISYLVVLIVFSIYTSNTFLNDSMILIIIVITGLIGLTYYLVNLFEKALFNLQENSRMIQTQNDNLNEANRLMKERQHTIEAQSERLQEQANELKIKNHELNCLNDSKNLFFSIIAHDLKNPFSIIMGYAELLRKRYKTLSDEKRSKYIELIESTSAKTNNLLENLLNWARSQTDKIKLNFETIILNDIVQEVLDLYSENIRNKEIEIDYSPDLLYEVYADKDTISIVVRNIISNAVKFSYNGGKILITINESNGQVDCMVKDYGKGIAQDNLDKLFDINNHLSSIGTLGEIGTGLGLILCKIFTEQNKGEIHVESKPDEGTSFSFSLPANVSQL